MHSDPVPAARPAPGITPGRDGVMRWVHELSLWKNPTVLIATAKVLLLAASVPALLVGLLALVEGDGIGAALGSVAQVGGIVVGIVAVLLLIAYPLTAILQGGRYCVVFEMDERGVRHTQLRKQFERNQALAFVTVLPASPPAARRPRERVCSPPRARASTPPSPKSGRSASTSAAVSSTSPKGSPATRSTPRRRTSPSCATSSWRAARGRW